jgi:hypothetical protein
MSPNDTMVKELPDALAADVTAVATTITEATQALIAQVAAWRAQLMTNTRQIADDVASMAATPNDVQPVRS